MSTRPEIDIFFNEILFNPPFSNYTQNTKNDYFIGLLEYFAYIRPKHKHIVPKLYETIISFFPSHKETWKRKRNDTSTFFLFGEQWYWTSFFIFIFMKTSNLHFIHIIIITYLINQIKFNWLIFVVCFVQSNVLNIFLSQQLWNIQSNM